MDKTQKNYQITKVTNQTGQDLFLEAFIALLSLSGLSEALGPCSEKTSSLRSKKPSIGYVPEVGKFYIPHMNFQ